VRRKAPFDTSMILRTSKLPSTSSGQAGRRPELVFLLIIAMMAQGLSLRLRCALLRASRTGWKMLAIMKFLWFCGLFGGGERDFVKSNKIVDLWGYNEYEFTEQLSFRKRSLVCL